MKNFHSDGAVANVTLAAAVSPGDIIIQGFLVGVAVTGGEIGDSIAVNLTGAYSFPKKSGLAITQGDAVYWDATPGEITKTDTDTYVGFCFESADAGDSTVVVLLSRPDLQ